MNLDDGKTVINRIKEKLSGDSEASVMYLHAAVALIGSISILLTLEYEVLNLSEAHHTFIVLVEKTCVIIVIAYVVTRLKFFKEVLEKKFTLTNQIVLIVIFGLISIFGTYSGIDIFGAHANVRDLGPMVAGLVGGPVLGIGSALIGSLHRILLGGFTVVPCTIATLLSGTLAGLIYYLNKGKFIGILGAVVFASLMEVLHMLLTLLLATPYTQAVEVVEIVSGPMIFANALGMLIFAFMISNQLRELKTVRERDEYHDELERKKHELELAGKIQNSFLPENIPHMDDFEVDILNISSKEASSDFFDFIPINDKKVGLTIANVFGESFPTTLLMALSKTIMRNEAPHKNPNLLLDYLNRLISPDISSEIKITILYGILDLKNRIFSYSNAAHRPPILFQSSENKVKKLHQDDEILGKMQELNLKTYQIELKKGDGLIFYTDGLLKLFNKDNSMAMNNLMSFIHENQNINHENLIKKIKDHIDGLLEETPLKDNIIMIIITAKKD
ncbi:PP2C family protein-serine/threonine phosphatase [Methanobacterium alcaliphilum]|uniref:PP2C family protein-serine/threonine phosphatase n=1 Tax=Methanobacterium alcaliphilum TaxID=392018 RepID=UPI00200AD2E2|nr:LytS/YhcK type 5TM receptor domain-containing protein [Methanobacterium alcaliphilum]MCK9150682.1 SpoIIE family protein phosphatase [Methanobacterium alcaliphilum]